MRLSFHGCEYFYDIVNIIYSFKKDEVRKAYKLIISKENSKSSNT